MSCEQCLDLGSVRIRMISGVTLAGYLDANLIAIRTVLYALEG